MNKWLFAGISTLVILLFLIDQASYASKLVLLDVGQGDSLLLSEKDVQVLIDGGPDGTVLRRLGEEMPFSDRKIEFLIISHPHDDHLAGLLAVMERYEVGSIIYMKGADFGHFKKDMGEIQEVNMMALEKSMNIAVSDDCKIRIVNLHSLAETADDNDSLFTKIHCGGLRIAANGDSGYKMEEALIQSGEDLQADILKASHHGSKTANSEAFIQAVAPRMFIISVGAENRFGHPSPEVLQRANIYNIDVRRTDQEGSVHIY